MAIEQLVENQLNEWTQSDTDPILALCVLRGAAFFFCDLTRLLPHQSVEIAFCSCSSYGYDESSSGQVKIEGLNTSVKSRRVLIVDDIYDSGLTMKVLSEKLLTLGAREVKTCTMFKRENSNSGPDFFCFTASEGDWLVGYGMDDKGMMRNLPHVEAKKT